MQWRSKGGWWGWFAPGGKIEVIPKKLERVKVFWRGGGEILGKGYKRAVDERKLERDQKKKVVKKIWGIRQKSRGAASTLATPLCECAHLNGNRTISRQNHIATQTIGTATWTVCREIVLCTNDIATELYRDTKWLFLILQRHKRMP